MNKVSTEEELVNHIMIKSSGLYDVAHELVLNLGTLS